MKKRLAKDTEKFLALFVEDGWIWKSRNKYKGVSEHDIKGSLSWWRITTYTRLSQLPYG